MVPGILVDEKSVGSMFAAYNLPENYLGSCKAFRPRVIKL